MAGEKLLFRFKAGLDTVSRESSLPEGAMRVCNNFDVTKDGNLLVRKGLRLVLSGEFHSLYSHPQGYYMLAVKDGMLGIFNGTTFTAIKAVSNNRVSYACLNETVYFCNGSEQGSVDVNGALGYWGLPVPPSPRCYATSGGGLYAGTYQVTQTTTINSLESGAPESVEVDVEDKGGISVTVPTSATAQFTVYVTTANDPIFRKVGTYASGSTINIGLGPRGKMLDTLLLTQPPSGTLVAEYKGRLWIVQDNVLWFTHEYGPHYVDPAFGYYMFDGSLTLVASAEDGLYVGTDSKIYFLQGQKPSEMTVRQVLQRGAISWSQLADTPTDVFLGQGAFPSRCCSFISSDGVFCIGRPGGIIQQINSDTAVFGNAAKGSLSYWTHDGLKQFIACLQDTDGLGNTADDVDVSEVNDYG